MAIIVLLLLVCLVSPVRSYSHLTETESVPESGDGFPETKPAPELRYRLPPIMQPPAPQSQGTEGCKGLKHWVVYMIGYVLVPGSSDSRRIQQGLLKASSCIVFYKVNYPKYVAAKGVTDAAQYAVDAVEKDLVPHMNAGDKISVIGHSYGGLVGRMFIVLLKEQKRTLWNGLVKSNFIGLGVPNAGQSAEDEDALYVVGGSPMRYVMYTEQYAKDITAGSSFMRDLASFSKIRVLVEFANVCFYGAPGYIMGEESGGVFPKASWFLRRDWMVNFRSALMLPKEFKIDNDERALQRSDSTEIRETVWPNPAMASRKSERRLRLADQINKLSASGEPCGIEALAEEIQSIEFLVGQFRSNFNLLDEFRMVQRYEEIAHERSAEYYEVLELLSKRLVGPNIHRYAVFLPDWVYETALSRLVSLWTGNRTDFASIVLGAGHMRLAGMIEGEASARTLLCSQYLSQDQDIVRAVQPMVDHISAHFME
eukprot:GHVQ01025167.1.p1 GENE.GHVQ01025167.1~~GHVQ01025167.1.p1  ORF type:complete len:483 (-),score=42.29 GHVQ01025167.1:2166-3614(-)